MDSGVYILSRIGQVSLPVKDLERATEFYREHLGMHFLFQVPGMAFFDCEGTRLMLAEPEKEEKSHHSGSILYFKVDDIHPASDALKLQGVHFVSDPHRVAEMPDHDLWMAFFKDSEDNTLALMAEVRS